jgi:hypothetical protein
VKTLRIAIPLPNFIGKLVVSPLLFYRRIRFGYAFRLIPLNHGKFTIVDPDDYEKLAKYNWFAVNYCSHHWYAIRSIPPEKDRRLQTILMHREIMTLEPNMVVDHINGNGLDNRRANLRPATKLQNAWNRKKIRGNFTSRFKGVSWFKRNSKWRAKITYKGKRIFLGYFDDEEAAARAYDAKARELFGEFAWLNLPEDTKPLLPTKRPNLCQNNDGFPPTGP